MIAVEGPPHRQCILYLLGAEFTLTEGEPGHCQQHGARLDESPV